MADARQSVVEYILSRSLVAAATLNVELIDELVRRLGRAQTGPERLVIAREILDRFAPAIAQLLTEAETAAWLAGIDKVFSQLPGLAQTALEPLVAIQPPITGPPLPPLGQFDEPIVRFPLIEEAARDILGRQVVTRDQFDLMAADSRARAFTMAGETSVDAIETVRDVMAETIERGTSLRRFREALGERLEGSFLGPAHLENVYRTNVQSAFHRGHDRLANDAVVREVFPYQEYLPIHDARTRPEHLALGRLGLNGTGVYRRDDPFWDVFTPPWAYQCRCGVNLLTIAAAAAKGVVEARRWERTGQAPDVPEWRLDAIPFRPDPEFVSGRAA